MGIMSQATCACVAHTVLLVQPSSAAAEKTFSLLKSSFGERQDSFLQESSVMLQYNCELQLRLFDFLNNP